MIAFYFFLLFLLIIDLKPRITLNKQNRDYISKQSCTTIKGIFVTLVFFRHFRGYITPSENWQDHLFVLLDSRSSQLIVTMFFFYSGFGIIQNIKKIVIILEIFLKKDFYLHI